MNELDKKLLGDAARIIIDFIKSCPGDGVMTAPDGSYLHGDWGYCLSGAEVILKWVEGGPGEYCP